MTRVIHFEIHATNPEVLAEFYKKVFGWEVKKWEGPWEYWVISTGHDGTPGINGAILQRRGAPPAEGAAVNGYVNTIDVVSVETTVQLALENGGSIALPKMPVPGMGWLAYCKDPDGNIFGIMQNDATAE